MCGLLHIHHARIVWAWYPENTIFPPLNVIAIFEKPVVAHNFVIANPVSPKILRRVLTFQLFCDYCRAATADHVCGQGPHLRAIYSRCVRLFPPLCSIFDQCMVGEFDYLRLFCPDLCSIFNLCIVGEYNYSRRSQYIRSVRGW